MFIFRKKNTDQTDSASTANLAFFQFPVIKMSIL